MIFDSHAHYNDASFDADREALLLSLPAHGVDRVCEIGFDLASSRAAVALDERFCGTSMCAERAQEKAESDVVSDTMQRVSRGEMLKKSAADDSGMMKREKGPEALRIYAAVGIHPEEAGKAQESDLAALRALAQHPRVLAIGEIGLDYYWPEPAHDVQKLWFERQIALAKELGMPIAIHSREAAQDTYDMAKALDAAKNGGIVHCFSYPKEMAKRFVELGMHIGIGGVLTFKNARKLREAAEWIPLDRIVLETDCPYMAPEPKRGTRNDSSNLMYVAEKLAEIKGVDVEEVIAVTARNAEEVYRVRG